MTPTFITTTRPTGNTHRCLPVYFLCLLLLSSCGDKHFDCSNVRGFQDGWFQQTWFTKPERKAAYIGAIFDDHTGEIRWADNTLMGDYCIADKTIYFSPSSRSNETLVIEILNISEDRMTLKMPDGQELMLYNPYPDLNQEIDLGSPVK